MALARAQARREAEQKKKEELKASAVEINILQPGELKLTTLIKEDSQ